MNCRRERCKGSSLIELELGTESWACGRQPLIVWWNQSEDPLKTFDNEKCFWWENHLALWRTVSISLRQPVWWRNWIRWAEKMKCVKSGRENEMLLSRMKWSACHRQICYFLRLLFLRRCLETAKKKTRQWLSTALESTISIYKFSRNITAIIVYIDVYKLLIEHLLDD